MPQFTVRGEVVQMGDNQYNVRVQNAPELDQFWRENDIDTRLDWAGDSPPLVTVSRADLVALCRPGDTVDYNFETWDRADGRRIRGLALSVVA